MKWWKRLFRKVNREDYQDDWEEIVYARDGVDFWDEEQRSRYIISCLEQMQEATREIDLLTGEYTRVTTYLTDMEEIEALPEEEREEINTIAHKLIALEQERNIYRDKKNRMGDSEYYQMRKQENEIEEGLKKIKQGEKQGALIKQDLQRLNGERHAYAYRKAELETMMVNFRGMVVIFLTALVLCLGMLAVLQFALEMNTYAGYFLAMMTAAIAITVLCIKYADADKEKVRVEKAINKLIQLQNKVKIRYVNNTQLMDYLYMKYNTDSASRLERRWKMYQQEKEERKQYAEAEAKAEYYQEQLIVQLSHYRVSEPSRWVNQISALLDKREMVEIRHDLIIRRQSLRKQMDYNNDVAESAHAEIMDVVQQYPEFAQEILGMVNRYTRG